MIKKRSCKKGVSPIIATILLIALVIVIGTIVFVWFKSMTQEAITKFEGQNVELVCDDINLDVSYSSGTLSISNSGNVPIYRADIKVDKGRDGYSTSDVRELSSSWPDTGLNQGMIFTDSINFEAGAESIVIIPVLIGDSDSGKREHVCDENRYGKELLIY